MNEFGSEGGRPVSHLWCPSEDELQAQDYTASALPSSSSKGQLVSVDFQGEGLLIPLGNYVGVRWSRSERATGAAYIPLVPGVPIKIWESADVFLRQDPATGGGTGTVTLVFVPMPKALMHDRQLVSSIARAVAGMTGQFGDDFPTPSQLSDADPNPTTTRVGADLSIFNGTTWDRVRSESYTDGRTSSSIALLANVYASAYNDRTTLVDRLRQPNAWAPKCVLQSAISIASTGVKATRTMAQDGWIRAALVSPITGTPTGAIIALQIVRSAVTYLIGSTGALGATLNVTYSTFVTSQNQALGGAGIPVISGDVVQVNVLTAAGAACTCDFLLAVDENRFAH